MTQAAADTNYPALRAAVRHGIERAMWHGEVETMMIAGDIATAMTIFTKIQDREEWK